MADMFADNLVKRIIGEIIIHKDTLPDNVTIWKSLTRLMFKNYPAVQVWEWMEKSLAEASDEQWFENKYPPEIFKEKFVDNINKGKYKRKDFKEYPLLYPEIEKIVSKVSILELADKYGLRPLGKLKRVCPFHADKNPSLSLNDEKGLFKCFGCSASGNIIKFKAMLNKIGAQNGSE